MHPKRPERLAQTVALDSTIPPMLSQCDASWGEKDVPLGVVRMFRPTCRRLDFLSRDVLQNSRLLVLGVAQAFVELTPRRMQENGLNHPPQARFQLPSTTLLPTVLDPLDSALPS